MTIPELTEKQRMDSFISERLYPLFSNREKVEFTQEGLAKFCLHEIDYACNLVKSTDIKDVEEQFED